MLRTYLCFPSKSGLVPKNIITVLKENILIFIWKILTIDCQNFSVIQNKKKQLKCLCKKISISLLQKIFLTKKDKNVGVFSSLMKAFPLHCLYQVTGTNYVPFHFSLDSSKASLPNVAASLEKLTPVSLTPAQGSWSSLLCHKPGKAKPQGLERCSVLLSAEQSSHQC